MIVALNIRSLDELRGLFRALDRRVGPDPTRALLSRGRPVTEEPRVTFTFKRVMFSVNGVQFQPFAWA